MPFVSFYLYSWHPLIFPILLHAGTDWAPLNPAELQMKDLPEQPGAPAFVLFREEIDNDQQGSHSVYMRIKVLSEAGRKYADVQIPYYKEEFNISDVHGRTIHPDGSIVEFQGKPFDKMVVKSKTLKVRDKSFTLPDVQVGSMLEYKYTLHYERTTQCGLRVDSAERSIPAQRAFQVCSVRGSDTDDPRRNRYGTGLQLDAAQGQ